MIITIHRSERLIYSLRRIPDRIRARWDTWSFEPNLYDHRLSDWFMLIWTGSRPVSVHAPFGSVVIPRQPSVDMPEYRHALKVHWDPTGILAEQVYGLALRNERGFRFADRPSLQPAVAKGGIP